jgi:hypothetical protein
MLRVVSDGRSLVADLNAARNEASAFCLQSRNDCFGFSNIGHLDFPFSPFAPTATGRRAKRRAADRAKTATTATAVVPIGARLGSSIAPAGRWRVGQRTDHRHDVHGRPRRQHQTTSASVAKVITTGTAMIDPIPPGRERAPL